MIKVGICKWFISGHTERLEYDPEENWGRLAQQLDQYPKFIVGITKLEAENLMTRWMFWQMAEYKSVSVQFYESDHYADT